MFPALRTAFAPFRQRLAERPDSEHGQAGVRLAIALLILLYLWVLRGYKSGIHVDVMILVMLAEFVVAVGIMASIMMRPGTSHIRRCVGMVTDYTTLAVLMSLNAAALSPLYVIILWVTIGNGLRYGTRYLYAAASLSAIAFLMVILANPFWRECAHHPYICSRTAGFGRRCPGYLKDRGRKTQSGRYGFLAA